VIPKLAKKGDVAARLMIDKQEIDAKADELGHAVTFRKRAVGADRHHVKEIRTPVTNIVDEDKFVFVDSLLQHAAGAVRLPFPFKAAADMIRLKSDIEFIAHRSRLLHCIE